MPSTTPAQQKLMALAYRKPSQVSKKNRGVLRMPKQKLREFMSLSRAAKKPGQARGL